MKDHDTYAAINGADYSVKASTASSTQNLGSELVLSPSSTKVDTLSVSNADTLSITPVHILTPADTLSVRTVQTDTPNGQGGGQGKRTTPDSQPIVLLEESPLRTVQQERLLSFLRQCRHCVTSHNALGRKLDMPYGSVRRIIRRLTELGFIGTRPYYENGAQGIEIWCYGEETKPAPSRPAPAVPADERTGDTDRVIGQALHIEERKIEKENQSIWNLSADQVGELWPHATNAGLYPGHLRQARDALHIQGQRDREEAIVAQSLRFLDWQMEQGGITDKDGKPVTNPVAYWLRSLQRNGYYAKPNGYVDPHLLALKQLEEEESARLCAEKKLLQAREEHERLAMEAEINTVLQALAEEGERHPLWNTICQVFTPYTLEMIRKSGSAALMEQPMLIGITRQELRRIYGIPSPSSPSPMVGISSASPRA